MKNLNHKLTTLVVSIFIFILSPNIVSAGDVLFEVQDDLLELNVIWGRSDSTVGTRIAQRFVPLSTSLAEVCNVSQRIAQLDNPTDDVVLEVYSEGFSSTLPEAGDKVASAVVHGSDLPSDTEAYTAFNLDSCLDMPAGSFYWFVWSRSNPDGTGKYITKVSPYNVTYQTEYYWLDSGSENWKTKEFGEWSMRLETGVPSQPEADEIENEEPELEELEAEISEVEFKNPVLIIPGIAGTELYSGDDLIWPDLDQMFWDINDQFLSENLRLGHDGRSEKYIAIGDTIKSIEALVIFETNIFKDLEVVLQNNKYALAKSLFYFPYDWRLDLDTAKDLLNERIEEIKSETGSGEIDIIAHSMGGLVVKNYINNYGKDSIDKLIFIGTPHLGAPKAGKALLVGDNFSIPWLEKERIKEISRNSPAVYELLPQPTYFNKFQGYIKTGQSFLDYSQTKDYLLSADMNASLIGKSEDFFFKNLQDIDLSGIDAYNIASCGTATQAGYTLKSGKIKQIGYTSGDETVPLLSAKYLNIPDDKKFYVKKAKHAELPSNEEVTDPIINILSEEDIEMSENFSNVPSFCNFKGKQLTWKSPVEVHIYDDEGGHTGPIENNTIEYGILGVDYEIIDGEKFIFLPTDDGQSYKVMAKGEEAGKFDLFIGDNEDGNLVSIISFKNIAITSSSTITFDVSGDSADDTINFDYDGSGEEILEADDSLDEVEVEEELEVESESETEIEAEDNLENISTEEPTSIEGEEPSTDSSDEDDIIDEESDVQQEENNEDAEGDSDILEAPGSDNSEQSIIDEEEGSTESSANIKKEDEEKSEKVEEAIEINNTNENNEVIEEDVEGNNDEINEVVEEDNNSDISEVQNSVEREGEVVEETDNPREVISENSTTTTPNNIAGGSPISISNQPEVLGQQILTPESKMDLKVIFYKRNTYLNKKATQTLLTPRSQLIANIETKKTSTWKLWYGKVIKEIAGGLESLRLFMSKGKIKSN